MTNGMPNFEADEDLTKSIAPKGLNHAKTDLKSDFYPWHKPRKQWIRENQWNESISRLITQLELDEKSRPLSYLSLPGPDLLDVRAIYPICVETGVKLRFLGLNYIHPDDEAVEIEQALSISEVRAMKYIDSSSTVEMDKFEHIGKPNSIAHSKVIKNGKSFDVVNIDLCGSFAETAPGTRDPNYYQALFSLLRHQATGRIDDWLFFLTTRNNQDMVHTDTFAKFIEKINELLSGNPSLKDTFISKGILDEAAFADGGIDCTQLDSKSFANSFLLGVGNWIIHVLLDNNPRWKVSTLPVYGYHVANKTCDCDMMSLGFYCSRIPEKVTDGYGLAGQGLNINVQSPEQVAAGCFSRLIGKTENQIDVDVMLFKEPDTYTTILDRSADLLRAARYKEEAYRDWVDIENQKLFTVLSAFSLL